MSSSAALRDAGSLPRVRTHTNPRDTRDMRLLRVSEHAPRDAGAAVYEPEGSERVTRGSVSLPDGGWWSAELSVALDDDRVALLRLTRDGGDAPSGADRPGGETRVELLLPVGEADALVALVAGVVQHARSDAVLPARAG